MAFGMCWAKFWLRAFFLAILCKKERHQYPQYSPMKLVKRSIDYNRYFKINMSQPTFSVNEHAKVKELILVFEIVPVVDKLE